MDQYKLRKGLLKHRERNSIITLAKRVCTGIIPDLFSGETDYYLG